MSRGLARFEICLDEGDVAAFLRAFADVDDENYKFPVFLDIFDQIHAQFSPFEIISLLAIKEKKNEII